jgi:hypothetical protein
VFSPTLQRFAVLDIFRSFKAPVLIVWMALVAAALGQVRDLLPVGVKFTPPADAAARRQALEEMRSLRFVAVTSTRTEPPVLDYIDRLIGGAPFAGLELPEGARIAHVPVQGSASELRLKAWEAVATGARAIVFDDWEILRKRPDAKTAASAFAETIARNSAFYATLRPSPASEARRIRVSGGASVDAYFLESRASLMLIVLNRQPAPVSATLAFSRDVPEAIWRNMLTGGSVNFIAARDGPTYPRALEPHEVVVLVIDKRLR